jgi:hypothetical protein
MSTATRAVKIAFFSSLTAIAICAAPAKADTFTFNFNDEYYVAANKSSTFQSIFGTTAGYSGAGIYQLTNSSTPTVTKLSNGSSVPGEFVENTAPNASEGLQLFGWSQSLNNGQQVANVYNLNNPINGTNTYFQFKTGVTGGLFGNGTTTAFNFDSFDLKGSTGNANLNFTLEGFRNGVLIDSIAVNVTGNTFKTYTENWTNVDTIVVASNLR